jgi:hypothetical protein
LNPGSVAELRCVLGSKILQPIPLPGKRKPLVTLRDAVKYMTSLPRYDSRDGIDQRAANWQLCILLAFVGKSKWAEVPTMYSPSVVPS